MKALKGSLILTVSFVLFFTLQGCDKEEDHKLQLSFYYQNSGDRTLRIIQYKNNGRVENFTLSPRSAVQFLNINTEGAKNHQPADFDKFFQQNSVIDSVYILFDSERLQRYTLNDGKTRSVLEVGNYQSSEKGKNRFEFVYEFIEADFESAEEIK